ncbi:MAG: MATE family efflux transporter [Bacteroidales bacterium]|jgi:putative MATE family efflux protein|nr:MATE family efflux transporter [Bacteroidales bacterium]
MSSHQHSPLVLGTEPVRKLLAQYAFPAIIAMTAASLYNIVDSIFIGHGIREVGADGISRDVGHLAIAGLALTYPLMNLAAAFGSLVGVGASTLVSIKLGQKDYQSANRVLGNVLVLNIILGVVFSLLCYPFLDSILYFFGASEHTIPYARDFMHIILLGNVVTHMYLGLNAIIRSAGNPHMAMYTTLLSVGVNCLLAPLFIFGFEWGIKGAAWATVIAQIISLGLQIIYLTNPNRVIGFRKGIYRLKKELVNGILSVGLSPFLMNICSCLIVILINRTLKEHDGDVAISAYGIINRIIFLFVMVVMGLNQGMQPIAGYNYGARRIDRVTKVTHLSIRWAVGITLLGTTVCQLFPRFIVGWFTTDLNTIAASVFGMRLVFAVFPIVGFQMVASNFFLSIGKPKIAIFLSLTRQMLFLVPCLLILPLFFQTLGVWLSLPIADSVSAAVTAVMFVRTMRSLKPS